MKFGVWASLETVSRKFKFYLNPVRTTVVLHEDVFTLWQHFAEFFLEWEIVRIKVVEKMKTHSWCSVTFFRGSCRLLDNVEKCGAAREATIHNTIWWMRVACWISKATRAKSHIHTHTEICNTYCFATSTMVTWTLLNVTLYVHCFLVGSLPDCSGCLPLNICNSTRRHFPKDVVFVVAIGKTSPFNDSYAQLLSSPEHLMVSLNRRNTAARRFNSVLTNICDLISDCVFTTPAFVWHTQFAVPTPVDRDSVHLQTEVQWPWPQIGWHLTSNLTNTVPCFYLLRFVGTKLASLLKETYYWGKYLGLRRRKRRKGREITQRWVSRNCALCTGQWNQEG